MSGGGGWRAIGTAVVTNGAMFIYPEVRAALIEADLILPSLERAGKLRRTAHGGKTFYSSVGGDMPGE
jgi:hypothetical protein